MRGNSKLIGLILYAANSKIEIYNVKIDSFQHDFNLNSELNAGDNDVLLTIHNPNSDSMLQSWTKHL